MSVMHFDSESGIEHPPADAFLELEDIEPYTDGSVECLGVALANAKGEPAREFAQGEEVHLFFEFRMLEDVGLVSGGVELADSAGSVVYGADSYQCALGTVRPGRRGLQLRFHRVIRLNLAAGSYTVCVGLVSVPSKVLRAYSDEAIGYEEFSKSVQEHWRGSHLATIRVVRPPNGSLSHHGLVNLPARQEVTEIEGRSELPEAPAITRPWPERPTVYHVTHWKAGSQWIHQILRDCAPESIVPPRPGEVQFRHWPLQQGMIYPTLYVTKEAFDARVKDRNHRRFVIVRDLRDTLVSAYFSMKVSHPILGRDVGRLRNQLDSMPFDEGMVFMMDEWLPECAKIQVSWVEAGERLIRYEDLVAQDIELFQKVLLEEIELPVSRDRFRQVVLANRFESVSGGRKPGHEDIHSHHRKGVVGDWKNCFSPRVKDAFKARFGGLLVATGYEHDLNW
jgi:hypothetical protein